MQSPGVGVALGGGLPGEEVMLQAFKSFAEKSKAAVKKKVPASADESGAEGDDASHDARDVKASKSLFSKLGVRERLFLSFGFVAALTVLASGIAWKGLDEVSSAISDITGEAIPDITRSLTLAEQTTKLAAAAPVLSVVADEAEREQVVSGLRQQLEELKARIATLQNDDVDTAALTEILASLEAQIDIMDKAVAEKLAAGTAAADALLQVELAHEAALRAVKAAIGGSNAVFTAESQLIPQMENQEEIQEALTNLFGTGLRDLQIYLEIEAQVNLVAGKLSQAATLPNLDIVWGARAEFEASVARFLRVGMASETSMREKTVAALAELQALGEGDATVFDHRIRELEAREKIFKALEESRNLSGELSSSVQVLADAAQSSSQAAAENSHQAVQSGKLQLGIVALVSFLAAVLIAWLYVGRNLVRRLLNVMNSMDRLAAGDLDVEVPHDGSDEIARMGDTVQVFKDNALEAKRLQGEQERLKEEAEAQKRQMLLKMADDFEEVIGTALNSVSSSSDQMHASAQAMSETASDASSKSQVVASGAEQTMVSVNTVASATEELSSSINEISGQVTKSSSVANDAVAKAEATNEVVKGLAEAANRIGAVVQLITDIAEQTNLLALNATIEAARAGEAGKGFAVVATEVKNLASQTGKATQEIADQIGGIQGATQDAVKAISEITEVVAEVDEIATSIASAIEEQGAATQEIARNAEQAASGTQEVTSNIQGITEAVARTGNSSSEIREASGALSQQASLLKQEADKFVELIRAG